MLLVYVCVLLQVGAGLHLETPTKNYRDDVASSEAASSEEHLHVRKAGDAAGSSQVHPGEQVLTAGEFGRSRRYIGDGYIGGLKGSNVDEEEDPVTVILVFYEQLMILREVTASGITLGCTISKRLLTPALQKEQLRRWRLLAKHVEELTSVLEFLSILEQCLATEDSTKTDWTILSIAQGIAPGTLWCGQNQLAQDLKDLGILKGVDRCCRFHDLCPVQIGPFSKYKGVVNTSPKTLSHCDCDVHFADCLGKVKTLASQVIFHAYFNVIYRGGLCARQRHFIETTVLTKSFLNMWADISSMIQFSIPELSVFQQRNIARKRSLAAELIVNQFAQTIPGNYSTRTVTGGSEASYVAVELSEEPQSATESGVKIQKEVKTTYNVKFTYNSNTEEIVPVVPTVHSLATTADLNHTTIAVDNQTLGDWKTEQVLVPENLTVIHEEYTTQGIGATERITDKPENKESEFLAHYNETSISTTSVSETALHETSALPFEARPYTTSDTAFASTLPSNTEESQPLDSLFFSVSTLPSYSAPDDSDHASSPTSPDRVSVTDGNVLGERETPSNKYEEIALLEGSLRLTESELPLLREFLGENFSDEQLREIILEYTRRLEEILKLTPNVSDLENDQFEDLRSRMVSDVLDKVRPSVFIGKKVEMPQDHHVLDDGDLQQLDKSETEVHDSAIEEDYVRHDGPVENNISGGDDTYIIVRFRDYILFYYNAIELENL